MLLINIQIEKIHLPTILHCDFTSAGERATFFYQDRLEILFNMTIIVIFILPVHAVREEFDFERHATFTYFSQVIGEGFHF